VDEFTYIVIGGVVSLGLVFLAVGRWYPGSGADVVDWKPTRSFETEAQLELDDIDQMLEAQNERRRARGDPERTQEQVELEVASGIQEQTRRAAAYRSERAEAKDLDELLTLANARRRRRGEPEIDIDQLRAELES
jgi:hypothetical protein